MRDSPANTKDLLDSRSVVYYALILTFLFRQRRLIPLPISLLQHTPGPAFVQCLVIHTGAVGERERSTAVPYRDSPLRYTQSSMASLCSPPEVSGNRPRGWRPSRRTSDRWYRPHSQVHRDGQHAYGPQALSCIPLELQPFKKSPRMPIYTSREMAERHTTTG
jgi:hypothetical protein